MMVLSMLEAAAASMTAFRISMFNVCTTVWNATDMYLFSIKMYGLLTG